MCLCVQLSRICPFPPQHRGACQRPSLRCAVYAIELRLRNYLCQTFHLPPFLPRSTVVPANGTSVPIGWSCLGIFERAGPFVAGGTYQLPLFVGLPSSYILQASAVFEFECLV